MKVTLAILNNNFKPNLAQKFSRIKACNALVLQIILYGSKIWALKKKEQRRLTLMEMKVFRRTAGHTHFDHKRK